MYVQKTMRLPVEVVDADQKRIQAVVSSEDQDRDGDVVRVGGWDLTDFQRHPVLLANHDYFSLRSQIGEWTEMEIKGKKLVGVAQYFAGEGNEDADWAYNLASKGKAAFSVGFIPDSKTVKPLSGGRYEINGAKLLEVSQVVVPSNPAALQRMKGLLLALGTEGQEPGMLPPDLEKAVKQMGDMEAAVARMEACCKAMEQCIEEMSAMMRQMGPMMEARAAGEVRAAFVGGINRAIEEALHGH